MKHFAIFSVFCLSAVLFSCNKAAGEGGNSSISGKILMIDKNNDGVIVSQYYAMDQDVHIIYGDGNSTYNDKFSTSLDGSYSFRFLTPGKYTIFAYSKCDTCLGGQEAITKTVEITGKKQDLKVEDLIIFE
jgi:hypothetical protein